jgi:CheY-like chemotaxis protein
MGEPLKILVIEDVEADFQLIRRHLLRQGIEASYRRVEDLAGLVQALEVPGWDVVLSDYHVPGLDFGVGLNLIRTRYPELPVILVSGSVGEEQAVELLKQGVWDFVLKDHPRRPASVIERSLREAADLPARRVVERALRSSEERLQLALRASGAVVWDWNMDAQEVRECGPVAALFGWPEGFRHCDMQDLVAGVHPDDRAAVRAALQAAIDGRTAYSAEYRLLRPEGGYAGLPPAATWCVTRPADPAG